MINMKDLSDATAVSISELREADCLGRCCSDFGNDLVTLFLRYMKRNNECVTIGCFRDMLEDFRVEMLSVVRDLKKEAKK